jgi:putative flippase GtrA
MTLGVSAVRSAFVRHQAASVVATVVDFGTMVALVELARLDPAVATLVGATFGAVVNFTMNRHVTFERAGDTLGPQAARYAVVSAASAGLNALLEYFGTHVVAAPYLAVRIVVAVAVSVLWNYPMHRSFVFRPDRKSSDGDAPAN